MGKPSQGSRTRQCHGKTKTRPDAGGREFQKPTYHWEGFGRKSTKPPWFEYGRTKLDPLKRPETMWEASTRPGFGTTYGRSNPFVHWPADRLYRPEVYPDRSRLEISAPASPNERQLVDVSRVQVAKSGRSTRLEAGRQEKFERYAAEAYRNRMQCRANLHTSTMCEVKAMISGQAKTVERPLLYPSGELKHQMVLALENRAGPSLPYDQKPPVDTSPFPKWDQTMYIPYSRTRADFPQLQATTTGLNRHAETQNTSNTDPLTSGYLIPA